MLDTGAATMAPECAQQFIVRGAKRLQMIIIHAAV